MKRFFSKQNRALLSELVRTDFKLRYQGSALGYIWSLLRPLLLFIILYVVFVNFLKLGKDIPHYPVYLLLGIVLWNFFTEMTTQSLGSIVGRGDLIRKIKIPRWMIVLSSSISALISLGLNLLIVAAFMAFDGMGIGRSVLLFPLIILQIYFFAAGLSLFLSAAYVKFRDLSYIWEVILQAAFYLTPIIYPMSLITNLTLQKLILLNPMAQAIQDARSILVTDQALTINEVFNGGWYRLIPYSITIVMLVFGLIYFRKESVYFAEEI